MAYRNLREFVDDLDAAGSLKRITASVSPHLEITEITDRVTKAEGPALLFENVEGSDVPLLINAYGTYDRMAKALGVDDIEEIAAEIEDMIKLAPPATFMEKMKTAATLAKVARFPPKTVKSGPCQDVVLQGADVDLFSLPIITCWPEDAGPYITFGQVMTKSLESGARNVGLYRVQVFDKDQAAMHWPMHHHGPTHYRQYCDAAER
ncbi:MAG: UbiD family decarboxylase, partial [Candidatus Poribacteria bacterium]